MKDKLVEYVANPNQKPIVKHVSSMDKLGQRYKGNKFSLDDQFADFGKFHSVYVDEFIDLFIIEQIAMKKTNLVKR